MFKNDEAPEAAEDITISSDYRPCWLVKMGHAVA
jgi:hypothetical protein